MQASENLAVTPMHRWRLWIPAGLMVVAVVGSFAPNAIGTLVGVTPLIIEGIAAVIFLVLLFAMTSAARCVRCKQNLLFRSMGKEDAGSWLTRFMEIKVCPCCGYPQRSSSND